MKQKFWKKFISLGCVLIMLLVFAACSSSSEPTDIVELDILKNIKTDTVTETATSYTLMFVFQKTKLSISVV